MGLSNRQWVREWPPHVAKNMITQDDYCNLNVSKATWAHLNDRLWKVRVLPLLSSANLFTRAGLVPFHLMKTTGFNFNTQGTALCCNPGRPKGPHRIKMNGVCSSARLSLWTAAAAAPTDPPSAHFVVEDEGAEHQDPLSHPFHRLLPAYRSRRVRRAGVGQWEFKERGAGAEAERAEEEIRLHWGWLQRDWESGPPVGAAPRRQAVEIRRLFLFCHHCHHHNW